MLVEVLELAPGLQHLLIFEHSLRSVREFGTVFQPLLSTSKQGDSLPLLLFGFILEYSSKGGQESQGLGRVGSEWIMPAYGLCERSWFVGKVKHEKENYRPCTDIGFWITTYTVCSYLVIEIQDKS